MKRTNKPYTEAEQNIMADLYASIRPGRWPIQVWQGDGWAEVETEAHVKMQYQRRPTDHLGYRRWAWIEIPKEVAGNG